jgi:hypothetical protein
MPSRSSNQPTFCALVLLFAALLQAVRADTIILHLKNGDRLAGTIVSEDTNRVVLTTRWIKEVAVPVSEIERREKSAESALAGSGAAGEATTAAGKSAGTVPAGATNAVSPGTAARAGTVVGVTSVPSTQPHSAKHWKGEARVGADYLSGAKAQEIYYGRLKISYERPYVSNPKQYFRNILDYSVDYGQTEGVKSANRMEGSDKTDFDVGKRKFFVYNLATIGYDEVRRIDLHYEIGPGAGYHLLTQSDFVMNVEAGADYQAQDRADQTRKSDFFYRLAEDITWKLQKRLTFTEKFELFPVFDFSSYRARFEATMSYGIWQNLSLNFTVLDLYDTQPAQNVPKNDLQVRSSLGVTF